MGPGCEGGLHFSEEVYGGGAQALGSIGEDGEDGASEEEGH